MNILKRPLATFSSNIITSSLLLTTFLVTGCASTLEQLPKEAVVSAMGQLYSPSGYSFTSTSNFDDIQINMAGSAADELDAKSLEGTVEDIESTLEESSEKIKPLNIVMDEAVDAVDAAKEADSSDTSYGLQVAQAADAAYATSIEADSDESETSSSPEADMMTEIFSNMDKDDISTLSEAVNNSFGWVNTYIRNTSGKTTGTFDFKNKRFEIIPELEYKSKNSYSYQKYPLLIDLKKDLLIIDENPLSMFLISSEHQGKFTSISLKPVLEHADLYGIFKDGRSALLAAYEALPDESYERVSLNTEEKRLGATDKIRLTLGVGDFSMELARQIFQRREAFQEHIKNEQVKAIIDGILSQSQNPDTDFEMMSEKARMFLGEFVNTKTSSNTFDLLLNKKGKLIQMNSALALNGQPLNKFSYSVKGSGKTVFSYKLKPPAIRSNKENTVTLKEAMNGSLLGVMMDTFKKNKASQE